MMEIDEKVNKGLEENMRKGWVEHTGFAKDGDDIFRITEKGLEGAARMLTKDPDSVIFLLKIAQGNNDESFYKMLIHIADLVKSENSD